MSDFFYNTRDYTSDLCSQIKDWMFNCSDSCNLVLHSRAEKQGVAAAVWGPELPDLCSPPCQSCLWVEWMLENGGTTLWTAAAGQTTWQLREGARSMCNVPVCLRGGKPQWSRYLLPTNRVISPAAQSLKDIHTHTYTDEQGMQRL